MTVVLAACGGGEPPEEPGPSPEGIDVCALVPTAEVEALAGVEVQKTERISHQCDWIISNDSSPVKRIALAIRTQSQAAARAVLDDARRRNTVEPIGDLGDDAFWIEPKGVLYVMSGDSYLIGVWDVPGSPGREKLITLIRAVLPKLRREGPSPPPSQSLPEFPHPVNQPIH